MGNLISKSILRRMNYLSDQKGIVSRFINQEGAWDNHLANTKDYIINFLNDRKPESVAILGSGWLLDVPLEYLSEHMKRVMLVDIDHPPQIKHKIRKFANMELVVADISGGGILEVFNLVREYKKTGIKRDPVKIELQGLSLMKKTDCIVSLNILNQLDMLLADYLKKFRIYGYNELNNLRKRIQKFHIDSLVPERSCLITDYEEEVYDPDGTLSSRKDLLHTDLPQAKNKKKWKWFFDSSGSYYPGKKVVFNVVALEI
jgi:hypothetical protein